VGVADYTIRIFVRNSHVYEPSVTLEFLHLLFLITLLLYVHISIPCQVGGFLTLWRMFEAKNYFVGPALSTP
jgi:hypothetical protein